MMAGDGTAAPANDTLCFTLNNSTQKDNSNNGTDSLCFCGGERKSIGAIRDGEGDRDRETEDAEAKALSSCRDKGVKKL